MAKKIVLSILGGIAVCGLVLIIAGFSLGADIRAFGVSGGQLVYAGDAGTVPVVNLHGGWGTGYTPPAVENTQADKRVAAPFTAGQLVRMEIDLAVADLVVQAGDEFGLEVDGPLEYTTSWQDGCWRLTSSHSDVFLRDGRYWRGGQDVTTTFTLTLPGRFKELDVRLGMGGADIEGFELDWLQLNAHTGNMRVADTRAAVATLGVDMGELVATGMQVESGILNSRMGNVEYTGAVRNTLTANCNMGNITVWAARPAEYHYTAKTSMGNITIDGRGVAGVFSREASGGAGGTGFFLGCNMGNIEVIFT